MIRFTTQSGTVYTLDLESGVLVREGVKPLRHVSTGADMDEPDGDVVLYGDVPTLGEPFVYFHPTLYGCVSTPVVRIEEI